MVGISVAASTAHSLADGSPIPWAGPPSVTGQAAAAVRKVSEKSASRPRSFGSHSCVSGASKAPHLLEQNPRPARVTPAHETVASNSCASGQVAAPAPVVRSQVLANASSWSCSAAPKVLATADSHLAQKSSTRSPQAALHVFGAPWSQSLVLTQHVDWIDANTSLKSSVHEDVSPPWPMTQVCQADGAPVLPLIPNSA